MLPEGMPKVQSRVDFRMPEHLKNEIEEAATIQGVSLTVFFAHAAIERAREVKAKYATTILNDAERDAFMALMISPPEDNHALQRLMATEVTL